MGQTSKAAQNHYRLINESWEEAALPPPTGIDAIKGAELLWRMVVGGRQLIFTLAKGNRINWIRHGAFHINPNRTGWGPKGWADIVHGLSHFAHNKLNRKDGRRPKPHNFDQAKLERKMQRIVLERLVK